MEDKQRYLGIDYGSKRWGMSYGDELGVATPLPAIIKAAPDQRIGAIIELIAKKSITQIVVGYPVDLEDRPGVRAREVDKFVALLKAQINLPVHCSDERWTTQDASSDAAAFGLNKKNRKYPHSSKSRKDGTLDSRAATLMLQFFLDEHQSHKPMLDEKNW
jgi:putative holliday junction resolvase